MRRLWCRMTNQRKRCLWSKLQRHTYNMNECNEWAESKCKHPLVLLSDQMLHLWHWERLLWPDASRVRDPHLTRAQPSQLPVSAATKQKIKYEVFLIISDDTVPSSCLQVFPDVPDQQGRDWAHGSGMCRDFHRRCFTLSSLLFNIFYLDAVSCLIHLKTAEQGYRNFSRFHLCNISTHLLCCISAAKQEEQAMRGLTLTFLVLACYCRPPERYLMCVLCSYVANLAKEGCCRSSRLQKNHTGASCSDHTP